MAETHLQIYWDKIKERLKTQISPFTFDAYIEGVTPEDVINKKIVLKAATEMAADIIMKNRAKFQEAITSAGIDLIDFIVVVEGSETYTLTEEVDALEELDLVTVDKKFTFESFVEGPSNKFVLAAAKSVAEAPGENFNPLYIYGSTGLGKTHLLQAIANAIIQKKPSLKVLYTTSERFLNEYISSIPDKTGARNSEPETRFRNRYRNVDVLIVDDIQFWAGKYGVQAAFFHAFNDLVAQHKQIIISSDCPARELTTLEERLRSRFEGGLIAEIQPPDLETKIAILKRKALEKKYVVPSDVLTFLAQGSDNNVRTLEGRLNTVIFASKLHEEPLSLSLASVALQESVIADEQEEVTPEAILRATCSYYSITRENLLSKNKRQELVRARQICAFLMCELLSMPLMNIGKEMGGRDHSTVIYSRDKIAELMRVNDAIAKEVNDIKSIVLKQ